MELPKVYLNGEWYYRDDRRRQFRRCDDNPNERITFDGLLDAALILFSLCAGSGLAWRTCPEGSNFLKPRIPLILLMGKRKAIWSLVWGI